mmetsp:Transcript_14294/g.46117  ORF Transcript_14294/g.46117 Transcript_14294/m.46117 type:complete len:298 (+) Transcript_14294:14-907(+)
MRDLLEDVGDGRGELVDVLRVDAGHGDAARLEHVDVVLLADLEDLGLGHARVGEHADLRRDVAPVAARVQRVELGPERRAHVADAARHDLERVEPRGLEVRVVEDRGDDARAEGRRVRVHGARDLFQVAPHGVGLVGRRDGRVDGARALAVEPEVLREGHARPRRQALLQKVAEGPRVGVQIARREAEVGRVEEREQTLALDQRRELLPLVARWVDARRVVRAEMQQHHGPLRRRLEVRQQTRPLQPQPRLVEVGVGPRVGPARVLENVPVVAPRDGGDVRGPRARVVAVQELHGEA